ncbi:hypothetical protein [Helicobacter ailurogastricus]|uniref:Putative n=1 Tax=Helicobacter ailurogastricus TaxID=1578720 RepID=A0A0K2X5F4_9HELI|nr:hypothetical protein [Helicobacter ailurogastricus]CRF41241.1 hypothetical protein HAL011_10300 [Helicobacter ailurogastricus]CRF41861.1 hypothetical protein HAL013_00030 [Helicobacter ailurogastricus]CRF43555.1 hypothetical protein HAL09_00990 [Helicobacter ailurogastricus]CRF52387.1 putative [Helicobacter ailurogastricus]BDQ29518.1 hypothetical protein ASB7_13550 [Helicobacter ailurogastricus]
MRCLFLVFCLLFCGCANRFDTAYIPDFLEEKRTQATRKGEIIKDLRPVVSVFITHLNDVDPVTYHQREFFFVEIFTQDQSIYNNGGIGYTLYGTHGPTTPMWVRPIDKDEFDKILRTTNKYSKAYLVAFKKLDYISEQDAKLDMEIDGLGEMHFNFATQVPIPKF